MTTVNTNSSLSTARNCLRRYHLRYNLQLELDGPPSEALSVGSAWHDAHDEARRSEAWGREARQAQPDGLSPDDLRKIEDAPFKAINARAPGPEWATKLAALYVGYRWYYANDQIEIIDSEVPFFCHIGDHPIEGVIDAIGRTKDGRDVLVERKTTGDGVDDSSSYWDRLRMDTQVGIYSIALGDKMPSTIIYDVTRKPTIRPKNVTKAGVKEIDISGTYEGQTLRRPSVDVLKDLEANDGKETLELYGLRLISDIVSRPEFYFSRHEVPRTSKDYRELVQDVFATIGVIGRCDEQGHYPRNPNACDAIGTCPFLGFCSRSPDIHELYAARSVPPPGYRFAELHPEVVEAQKRRGTYVNPGDLF